MRPPWLRACLNCSFLRTLACFFLLLPAAGPCFRDNATDLSTMAQEARLNVPVVTGAPSHHTMRGEEKLSPKAIAIRGQEARWVLNALYELNF